MFFVKTLSSIFVLTVTVIYSAEPPERNATTNQNEATPKKPLDLNSLCRNLPNGNGTIVVNPKLCTRLYVHCENKVGNFQRCGANFYMNPRTHRCEQAYEIDICREFFNITFPTPPPVSFPSSATVQPSAPVQPNIADGATMYCRNKSNCDEFQDCCRSHCTTDAPDCKSTNETELSQDHWFCRCNQNSYLHNPAVSQTCLGTSGNCVQFHMCCLLNGCPNLYVQCDSNSTEAKPTRGACYC